MDAVRNNDNLPEGYYIPILTTGKKESKANEKLEQSTWLFRRLLDLGVIQMEGTQPKQPRWTINLTTITTLIIFLGFIIGLYTLTYYVGVSVGTEAEKERRRDAKIEFLEKELQKAKELQLYNNGKEEEEGHSNANTNTNSNK